MSVSSWCFSWALRYVDSGRTSFREGFCIHMSIPQLKYSFVGSVCPPNIRQISIFDTNECLLGERQLEMLWRPRAAFHEVFGTLSYRNLQQPYDQLIICSVNRRHLLAVQFLLCFSLLFFRPAVDFSINTAEGERRKKLNKLSKQK